MESRSKAVRLTKPCLLVVAFIATLGLSGCLVAGYSSRGGGFIWPGGIGLLLVALLIFFVLRRR